MAETVVAGSFFRIAQHTVRFGSFLKLLFGLGITGILVRMVFNRELPIGAFDFLIRAGADHAQHVVIVSFMIQLYSPSQPAAVSYQPASTNAPSKRAKAKGLMADCLFFRRRLQIAEGRSHEFGGRLRFSSG